MCERLLLCSILIQIIRKNLHYGIVRYTKLTCESVERNPGPRSYIIKKTINTSHHQRHVRYGRSAGMQCTSNAYLALSFRKLRTSIRGRYLILITSLNRKMEFLKMLT